MHVSYSMNCSSIQSDHGSSSHGVKALEQKHHQGAPSAKYHSRFEHMDLRRNPVRNEAASTHLQISNYPIPGERLQSQQTQYIHPPPSLRHSVSRSTRTVNTHQHQYIASWKTTQFHQSAALVDNPPPKLCYDLEQYNQQYAPRYPCLNRYTDHHSGLAESSINHSAATGESSIVNEKYTGRATEISPRPINLCALSQFVRRDDRVAPAISISPSVTHVHR
jgi:hypothetical protein